MVLIKELLPNPAGKDTVGEWVILINNGTESINLRGWSIKDAGGKKFIFGDETVLPNQEIKLPYSATRINLNNDGDTLTLTSQSGEKVDELNYGQVGEGEVVTSSKMSPPTEANNLVDASPLTAQAFTGTTISAGQINPLLIALGLALVLGIGAALLTKKLMEAE